MAAIKSAIADSTWVAIERQNASFLAAEERDAAAFDAANHFHWLNEHISTIFAATNPFQALKTPGRLRGIRTPGILGGRSIFADPSNQNLTATNTNEAEAEAGPIRPADAAVDIDQPMIDASESATEDDNEPTPKAQSPVQLYTESEIGSPSVNASPEVKPLRKGSFSFAPLPARDPLKQSLGVQTTEHVTTEVKPATAIATTITRDSLGLDTEVEDADDSDNESVDLRAPELIAHDERMKALEESSVFEPDDIEDMPFQSATTSPIQAEEPEDELMVDSDDEIHEPHKQMAVQDTLATLSTEIENNEDAALSATEIQKPTVAKERLRATKTAIGRPVRPTLSSKPKPQPVPIKMKSTFTSKPINKAPVAAHNQDAGKPEAPRNELKRKPSTQFVTPGPAKKPAAPLKVFAAAEKKKLADEAKAAKEAAQAQAMRERRDATIAARRQAEKDAQEELDRQARENSEERLKVYSTGLDAAEKYRETAERSQEREEADCEEKKERFRRSQEERATKPVAAPVKTALKCAMKPSLKAPPKIKPVPLKRTAPTKPPTRNESQAAARPASRFENNDERHENSREENLPTYPSNLSKPPVRASSLKKPSIFSTSTQGLANFPQPPSKGGHSMQQYATQRIPFANEPAPLQQHNTNLNPPARTMMKSGITTPYSGMQSMHTIQAIQETSPSEATLPEIYTDSEDGSQDDAATVASWATPGHLAVQLGHQENIEPDKIFPRIPTLSMEEVFQNNPRMARLKNRTSSAHWVRNGDALTEVEIKKDQEARKAIKDARGWTYGVEQ